jgi:hypothetical protein
MTVEEKVTQLVNQSRAVPRLNVPDSPLHLPLADRAGLDALG